MEGQELKFVLFSGRFDPPHLGHFRTIQLLARDYNVKVVVLDYPEQRFPISYRLRVLRETVGEALGNVSVVSNKTHFGKLTRPEWDAYGCDLYAAGNFEVLSHIEFMGIECIYVDRPYQLSARLYDKPEKA